MSEGPIKRERDAWKPKTPTPRSQSICLIIPPKLSPYCGRRKNVQVVFVAKDATCEDCIAAHAADVEVGGQ